MISSQGTKRLPRWHRGKETAFSTQDAGPQVQPLGGKDPLEEEMATQKNSMDRGCWWATVHGVAKSQTQLRDSVGMYRKLRSCTPRGSAKKKKKRCRKKRREREMNEAY